jgi:hypothetical protein
VRLTGLTGTGNDFALRFVRVLLCADPKGVNGTVARERKVLYFIFKIFNFDWGEITKIQYFCQTI